MGYPIYHSAYTAAQIEASIGKGPRVNASGFWEVWNVSIGAYESTGVGAGVTQPTVVTQVSQMTNHGYIYIYNGSESGYQAGYWYYWNGSAWTVGGAYQVAATDKTLSVADAAADAKATGDAVDELKSALGAVFSPEMTTGYAINNAGDAATNPLCDCSGFVPIIPGTTITLKGVDSGDSLGCYFYKADESPLEKYTATTGIGITITTTVPDGAYYVRVTSRTGVTPTVIYNDVYDELIKPTYNVSREAREKADELIGDMHGVIPYAYQFADSSAMELENNYIDSSTGEVKSSTGWYATKPIRLYGADSINAIMPTFSSANVGGMAFYDEDGSRVGGVAGRATGSSGYELVTIDDVPADAVFARFSIRAGDVSHFYANTGALVNVKKSDIDYLMQSALQPYGTIIYSGNYQAKGITSLSAIPDNKTVVFGANITSAMVSGLPVYNTALCVSKIVAASGYCYYLACTINKTIAWIRGSGETGTWTEITNRNNNYGVQLFKRIGVIGDSISCGWAKDKNGNNSRRNLDISWVQQMARHLGCTAYNLGASGVDPIEWFDDTFEFAQYCYAQYQTTEACDLYIIGLGLNGGEMGTIADINENDYTQNAETFYGQYARIIQMINHDHPNAIVMCLTEPTTRISTYDQAVRDICALQYINAELVDLENNYFDLFNSAEIIAEHQPDNLHFTPYGYSLIAEAMVIAMNDYIAKNASKFKYVGVANV